MTPILDGTYVARCKGKIPEFDHIVLSAKLFDMKKKRARERRLEYSSILLAGILRALGLRFQTRTINASQEYLAAAMRIGNARTIQRALKELQVFGLLVIEKRGKRPGTKFNWNSLYHLTPELLSDADMAQAAGDDEDRDGGDYLFDAEPAPKPGRSPNNLSILSLKSAPAAQPAGEQEKPIKALCSAKQEAWALLRPVFPCLQELPSKEEFRLFARARRVLDDPVALAFISFFPGDLLEHLQAPAIAYRLLKLRMLSLLTLDKVLLLSRMSEHNRHKYLGDDLYKCCERLLETNRFELDEADLPPEVVELMSQRVDLEGVMSFFTKNQYSEIPACVPEVQQQAAELLASVMLTPEGNPRRPKAWELEKAWQFAGSWLKLPVAMNYARYIREPNLDDMLVDLSLGLGLFCRRGSVPAMERVWTAVQDMLVTRMSAAPLLLIAVECQENVEAIRPTREHIPSAWQDRGGICNALIGFTAVFDNVIMAADERLRHLQNIGRTCGIRLRLGEIGAGVPAALGLYHGIIVPPTA